MKYRIQIQQIFGVIDGMDPYAAEWLDADVKPRSEAAGMVLLEKQAALWKNGAPHRLVKIDPKGGVAVIKTITHGRPFFTPAQQRALDQTAMRTAADIRNAAIELHSRLDWTTPDKPGYLLLVDLLAELAKEYAALANGEPAEPLMPWMDVTALDLYAAVVKGTLQEALADLCAAARYPGTPSVQGRFLTTDHTEWQTFSQEHRVELLSYYLRAEQGHYRDASRALVAKLVQTAKAEQKALLFALHKDARHTGLAATARAFRDAHMHYARVQKRRFLSGNIFATEY